MNQNINKCPIKKIIHISVMICLIVTTMLFGFEKKTKIQASSSGLDYTIFTNDDYSNPYIGRIGNVYLKFLDGKISYCLQSGKGLQKGTKYSLKEELNWSLESKELLSYVLYYGYRNYYGTSLSQYSNDDLACYLATQLLIWQLEYNSFYDSLLTNSLIEHYSDLKTTNGTQIGPMVVEYYKEIWSKADYALNGGTPSFSDDSDYIASLNVYLMEYSEDKEGYYIELPDTNQCLNNYQVMEDNGIDVSISNNVLTLYSKNEVDESTCIILENPYFAKGMKPLIWNCGDLAYQELTNTNDVIDISKTQYLYIKTKPRDNDEPSTEEIVTNEPNTEPGDNDNPTENTEDITTESNNTNTSEESSSTETNDTNTSEENSSTETNDTNTSEESGSTETNDTNTSEESSSTETNDTNTSEESSSTEEINNYENSTSDHSKDEPDSEENSTKDEISESDDNTDPTDENTTEEIIFEDEYSYESDLDFPEGRIVIEKIDGDTKEALAGVTFMISNYSGTYSITKETDSNGIIDLSLPYDNYYLQEISAPNGYATNNEKISFRITDEIPLCFQIINSKVPGLGMNFSTRNIVFSLFLVFLVFCLLKELFVFKRYN